MKNVTIPATIDMSETDNNIFVLFGVSSTFFDFVGFRIAIAATIIASDINPLSLVNLKNIASKIENPRISTAIITRVIR
jgi:hypothetical protein